jgi:hypothetical protein
MAAYVAPSLLAGGGHAQTTTGHRTGRDRAWASQEGSPRLPAPFGATLTHRRLRWLCLRRPVAFRAVPLYRSQDSAYHRTYHEAAVSFLRTWAKTSTTTGPQGTDSIQDFTSAAVSLVWAGHTSWAHQRVVALTLSDAQNLPLGSRSVDPSFNSSWVSRLSLTVRVACSTPVLNHTQRSCVANILIRWSARYYNQDLFSRASALEQRSI